MFRKAIIFPPLLCSFLSTPLHAAPPPAGSEDAKIMAPFKEWITSRHDRQGLWCCDIGDGRPVEAKLQAMLDLDGTERIHWVVHVTKEHFPLETPHWEVVPDDKIVPGINPTGSPIAWIYSHKVQCFIPTDGM